MEDSSSLITQRFKNFVASKPYKSELQSSLFSIMKEGVFFNLKRNKVLIRNTTTKTKDKLIILDVYKNEQKLVYYCCPVCTDKKIVESLTGSFKPESLSSCLHSDVCQILWGNQYIFENGKKDDKSVIEIIKQKPTYMAVVHPPLKTENKSGVVVLTTKTLTPKCLTCCSRGKNFCLHIKIHMDKMKKEAEKYSDSSSEEDSDETEVESHGDVPKVLRNKKLSSEKVSVDESDQFNPFKFSGSKANVFKVQINFIQTEEEESINRKISETNRFFDGEVLIPKYLGRDDICDDHGRSFCSGMNILWRESYNVEIHHTKDVETKDLIVLFRPTVVDPVSGDTCICKRFYTGKSDNLLRVTSASFIQSTRSRAKKLHFVSYELLFKFLGQLIVGGEKMDAFIKANNFMNEIFFGLGKPTMYPKILQKGFEMFMHALVFPEKANFCFQCPQALEDGEIEDSFDDIEYSIVDGIKMGCQTNDAKGHLPKEYFEEEIDGEELVRGVEVKDRTCLNSQKKRDAIVELLKDVENKKKLKQTIKKLENTTKDDITDKVITLLKRISKDHACLPKGYYKLFGELKLDTPISALLAAYSSDRKLYSAFYSYLKNQRNLFEDAKQVEDFVNSFPIVMKIIQDILEEENKNESVQNHFLPNDVSDVLKEMIRIRIKFDKLSRSLAVARKEPPKDFKPPVADVFPDYDIHTMDNQYKADQYKDKDENVDCRKEFESSSSISGGIGTVTCNHKITKGFRVMERGESPQLFLHSLVRRLPSKVKAKRRVVVYDFACKMHKCALRRFPYKIRRFQFVIDRHHQANHTTCSEAYNMSRYPFMNNVNSQLAEQLNNCLRKLSTVSAYSKFESYVKMLEIFITVKNLTIKKII